MASARLLHHDLAVEVRAPAAWLPKGARVVPASEAATAVMDL